MNHKRCPSCKAELKPEPGVELDACPECECDFEAFEQQRAELARRGEAHRLADHYGLGDVVAKGWERDGLTVEEMRIAANGVRAQRQPVIDGRIDVSADDDSPAFQVELAASGIVARSLSKRTLRADRPGAAQLRAHDSRTRARLCCAGAASAAGSDPHRDRVRIIRESLAAHSTSDFPKILENVLNKSLLLRFEAATQTYKRISASREFKDFRPHKFVRREIFPCRSWWARMRSSSRHDGREQRIRYGPDVWPYLRNLAAGVD